MRLTFESQMLPCPCRHPHRMSPVILNASPRPMTRTRSRPDVLWSIWALMLSSAPLRDRPFTLAKLQTHTDTRSRRWPLMTKHQSLRSPRMGMHRNPRWTSINSISISNIHIHLLSCSSRFPRRHRNHSNLPNPRGLTGDLVDIAWLILVLSAPQIRRFDEYPIGRAKGKVVVMPHQDITRETRLNSLVVLVLRRLRVTSI